MNDNEQINFLTLVIDRLKSKIGELMLDISIKEVQIDALKNQLNSGSDGSSSK